MPFVHISQIAISINPKFSPLWPMAGFYISHLNISKSGFSISGISGRFLAINLLKPSTDLQYLRPGIFTVLNSLIRDVLIILRVYWNKGKLGTDSSESVGELGTHSSTTAISGLSALCLHRLFSLLQTLILVASNSDPRWIHTIILIKALLSTIRQIRQSTTTQLTCQYDALADCLSARVVTCWFCPMLGIRMCVAEDWKGPPHTNPGIFFFGTTFNLVSALSTNCACAQRSRFTFMNALFAGKTTMSSEAWAVHKEKHRDRQPSTVGM